jgi:flagellin
MDGFMPLRIRMDSSDIGLQKSFKINNRALSDRIAKLASGLKINQAAHDAAGLVQSEGMRASVSGFAQAIRNSELAINQTQVSEGSLAQTHSILDRLRELSVQSASSGVTDANRASIQTEFSQLTAEVDRLAQTSPVGAESFQIGPHPSDGNQIDIDVLMASGPEIGLSGRSVVSQTGAQQTLSAIDNAIAQVSVQRSDMGVLQSRLGFAIRSNEQAMENLQASESVIRDADVALEASQLASEQVQTQANLSLLSQQNVNRQQVLNLLG